MTDDTRIALAVLGGLVVISWSLLARRWRRLGEPLPYEPRSPIRWTGREALLVIAAYVGCGVFGNMLAVTWYAHDTGRSTSDILTEMAAPESKSTPPPLRSLRFLQGKVACDLLFLLLSAVIFRFVYRTPPDELGLAPRPPADLRVGLAGFFVIVPALILFQWLLVTTLSKSVHPVIVALRDSRDGRLWSWSAVAVVGTAPLVEEFLFRGVIQNWLSRAWSFIAEPRVTEAGDFVPPSTRAVALAHDGPIVATAGFFALLHLGNGPDPIPLFFLALALGYLFRQTNRIWPGWVVHVLLNAFSLAVLPWSE